MGLTLKQIDELVKATIRLYRKDPTLEYELNETTAAVVHGLTENDQIPIRKAQE